MNAQPRRTPSSIGYGSRRRTREADERDGERVPQHEGAGPTRDMTRLDRRERASPSRFARAPDALRDCPEGCDCTWCRCLHDAGAAPRD